MSKYLKYKEEIVSLWNEGLGFITIADILIKKYNFSVSTDHFRKTIAKIIKNASLFNAVTGEIELNNVNENSALDLHLKERGIKKEDVVSVKHWQSMKGDLRFSIVTKEKKHIKDEE